MIAAILLAAAVSPCNGAQTQLALDECWDARAQAATTQMNQMWLQVRHAARAHRANLAAVAAEQNAWRAALHKTCALPEILYAGGSIMPMMQSECDAVMTNDRVAQLQAELAAWQGACSMPPRPVPAQASALARFYPKYVAALSSQPAARAALIAAEAAYTAYRARACGAYDRSCSAALDGRRVNELEATWLGEQFW